MIFRNSYYLNGNWNNIELLTFYQKKILLKKRESSKYRGETDN